jgi:GTP-binding protein
MKIKTAVFHKSSSKVSECPTGKRPEFAFIGRSNVGKSSLINMLTGQKGLAKISAAPGKTRLINHFLIDGNWFLVDLPGYGYARVSKKMKESFSRQIGEYLEQRESLFCLFILLDARLEPQEIDLRFINWCGEAGLPLVLVYTKTDKLSAADFKKNRKKLEDKLKENWEELPSIFSTSSEKITGRDEILDFIGSAMNNKKANN